MTYVPMQPVGSYFTFAPHEIMNGMGRAPLASYYTFTPHEIMSGFGAFDFSPDEVWSDWFAGQACPEVPAACARAKSAADTMRAALQQLGYGKLQFGVAWGSKDQQALTRFSSDLNLPPGGLPTKGKVQVMGEMLARGKKPGPERGIETHKVGTEFVPGRGPGRAGVGGLLAVGLVGAALIGGVVLVREVRKRRRR